MELQIKVCYRIVKCNGSLEQVLIFKLDDYDKFNTLKKIVKMISDTVENPCTGTISSLNSNMSMTSEGCLNIQVTSLISHPSLKNLDPILFGLQRIPSMLKVQVKGSNKPFDLNWNYEASDVNIKQPGHIERYLKVSFFLS